METKSKTLGTTLGFAALLLAVATARFWFYRASIVDIPEDRTLFVLAWLGAAALGVAAFVAKTRWFGAIPAVLGIVAGVFLSGLVAISEQKLPPIGIQVGETIPSFQAVNELGETFDSASLRGKPTLIKFFRGHW